MASYKDGLLDSARINADAQRKYEEYLHKLGEQNKVWQDRYGNIIDTVINDLASEDKSKLYGISTPDDIAKADRDVQELLVAILWELATNHSKPKDERSEELQELYIRSIQHYLGIFDIQSSGNPLLRISNIDSKTEERMVLQIVMEYLFLESNDHNYLSRHYDVFASFSKSIDNDVIIGIQDRIDYYLKGAGVIGLAQKYSYRATERVKENKQPATYKIDIRYESKDKKTAKRLKDFLENLKNTCELHENRSSQYAAYSNCDYIVILGDGDTAKNSLNMGQINTIFDAYGCSIWQPAGSNKLIIRCNPTIKEYDQEKFISFYKECCLVKKEFASINESDATAELEKKNKRKPWNMRIAYSIIDIPQKLMDAWDKVDNNNIALGLLSILSTIITAIPTLAVGIIVAIPEAVIEGTITQIQESAFDTKFVRLAQLDIVSVKLTEYIWSEQQKNAK